MVASESLSSFTVQIKAATKHYGLIEFVLFDKFEVVRFLAKAKNFPHLRMYKNVN